MKKVLLATALSILSIACGEIGVLACSCEKTDLNAAVNQQLLDLALRQPSEADRTLARGFRMRGMPIDAADYYRKAAAKASSEFNDNAMLAKHSAEVEREAAQFLQQKGDIVEAAGIWETALSTMRALTPISPQIAAEYGIIGSLYETAGRFSLAEKAFQNQLDMLQATSGRNSRQFSVASSDILRVRRKAQQSSVSSALH